MAGKDVMHDIGDPWPLLVALGEAAAAQRTAQHIGKQMRGA